MQVSASSTVSLPGMIRGFNLGMKRRLSMGNQVIQVVLLLVAAEPQIESPVAMAFDEDGKLWVVEMRDYPNGPAKGQPPEGRIKVLEDRDGDGRYETSRV